MINISGRDSNVEKCLVVSNMVGLMNYILQVILVFFDKMSTKMKISKLENSE